MDVMTETQALNITRKMLDENGLWDWRVILFNSKTTAGDCYAPTRTIRLSRPSLRAMHISSSMDTIIHEVAHAVVGPGHAHDRVWRAKAIQLGGSGATTAKHETLVHPEILRGDYHGFCPEEGCTSSVYFHRKPRIHRRCRKHRATLHWTYKGRLFAFNPQPVVKRRPSTIEELLRSDHQGLLSESA
jgi:predicted SprT family Zn-dependent metalloprotease